MSSIHLPEKNMKKYLALLSVVSILALAACGESAPPSQPAEQSSAPAVQEAAPAPAEEPGGKAAPAGIPWFEGSVEEAFALAQAENRPLFLYWGAVWCPPCVEIRNTVFKSPQFIAQTKLFIPVYLDGDTERAQTWGDRFETKVYPTMIVFNPAGEEITRLNAGIDISAYNTVLELSLESMRPMDELVRAGMADPSALGAAELKRLAYYSWYDGKALPQDAPASLFNDLSQAAADVDATASARLYLQYLVMLADEEATDPGALAWLGAILASPELAFAAWDYLIAPEQIVPALTGTEEEMLAIKEGWATTLMQNRHDERLSTKNQLYGWRPYLVFHFEGDDESASPLPPGISDAIRSDARAADESVAGTHSRQSVINTAANVLQLAGMTDEARSMLTAEIGKSKTPYYFMGSLASLEEDQGNDEVALEWRRKAYEASEGPATRIRWWASYVQALTRLAPADADVIRTVALFPFDPANGMDDLFAGANYRNLVRAQESLEEWDAEGTRLAAFDAALAEACAAAEVDCPAP
jgi:hypothetical protein